MQADDAGPDPLLSSGDDQKPWIVAEVAASFTYASYQNAIPVLRSILIENHGVDAAENCRVELISTPAFLRPKTWTIDRLLPGDSLPLADRRVELDPGYLAGLNEAERGDITLRLLRGEELLDERGFPVRLLARDEWGGVADMAQLLPAFVTPNDPAVASILRTAADRLVAHGHSGALDGYQSGDPARAYMLSAAIYSAIAGMALHYAEPPASFESRGQKIRRPGVIAQERLATCLDTTLLFASAIEAAGLHPVILMFQGHSAVGVWLAQRTFAKAIEPDQMEVRKGLASRELIVFETTGVTHRPAMTLEAAQRALDNRIGEEAAGAFVAAIDVRRARSGGITPLASHETAREDVEQSGRPLDIEVPLPAAPAFNDLPGEEVEQKPTTAAGRIDRWQRKLLDLTLRNRLLNFASSKKTIPFLCTDVAYLEDRLAAGGAIRIISLPAQNPLGDRDASLYRDVHGRDLQRGFAADALARDEIPSPLDDKELEGRLIELHRQVRNDFAEGGANTLFLAVGFLRWKKKPEDERSYRAPLLLVPVKLERRSASSAFNLRFHEDEPRFNATLLQFLEREFDLKLPQFGGELPLDESGIDVPRLLATARLAVRDVPGMEVLDETALSTFSFAKFLMWKDLVERTDALRENRIVRHLIDNPEQAFSDGSGAVFREEAELDRAYAPADIISILPSDSSQTAASVAAAEGRDFVIVGPPGTGKSQTIANMIANCLAAGKTVLFVAEKTAALDVVYRRLRENGLGDHCIELHSNKADRRRFLAQLKASWERAGGDGASQWVEVNDRLKLRRDALNAYVSALHRIYPNGWTPYLALGVALRMIDAPAPNLSWQERDAHDRPTLAALEDLAQEIGKVFASVERRPALHLVDRHEWSSIWQADMLAAAASLRNASELLADAIAAFRAVLGLRPVDEVSRSDIDALVELATALERADDIDLSVAFDPEFSQRRENLTALDGAIKAYREAERGLAASFEMGVVRRLDLVGLDRQWREAGASFWPLSSLGRRKVAKLLKTYAHEGKPQPERDLPGLRQMREQLEAIEHSPLNSARLPIKGLETDVETVVDILEDARRLRAALQLPGVTPEDLNSVTGVVERTIRGDSAQGLVRPCGAKLLAAARGFDSARQRFVETAGRDISRESGDPAALAKLLGELIQSQPLLRDWLVWCRVRRRAVASGLESLVDLIESGTIPAGDALSAFRLGYARWWLPAILDGDPVLRDFRRFQHENLITEFREIDDLVRAQAVRRVIDAIDHGLPGVQSVPRNSELGLLRHQMELQRPSQSIRDMIDKMPASFGKLAPCMLMSPLSIAQYFPPNKAPFDVVIFDEASQITTWDAVGAIARGRQTIIVGDPKQLPPTNFFGRNEDEEEVADHEKDLESILDEAKASGIPVRDLRWHYRSRSESLIAFSNSYYYQNRLVTFPSPVVEDRAVRLQKVPNGVYDRGKSRTNRIEGAAVAAEAVKRMTAWLGLPEKKRPTLGIITFNAQQQCLIMDFLDAARRNDPKLEWFFAEDRIEPTIVKNLENVQGDERDVILFSITFWKDAGGKLTMDFGALNRDGGERRLNVAVTRARQELIVFSGFTADVIDTSRTKAIAVHHLKTFLDYADRGAIALPAQVAGSQGGYDSPFEEAVAEQLQQRGWMVVPQVGISGFRIDLGVRHPDLAGAYLAGVECDGATYHSAATARDRDKVREQVLTGLGWNILRVWSTDWWFDPKGCADRLAGELEGLLAKARAERAEREKETAETDLADRLTNDEFEEAREDADPVPHFAPPSLGSSQNPTSDPAPLASSLGPTLPPAPIENSAAQYRITDFSTHPAAPERFYEFTYRGVLRSMVDAVIETESPLQTDVLCQRIARAHGWLRTGPKIRERIEMHLRDFDRTHESSGEFIWKKGAVVDVLPYRPAKEEDSRRSIGDIPLAELVWLVNNSPGLLEEPDPSREMARLLGVERLAATSRGRLDEAIAKARTVDVESSA
jgi:very-short-patch-repair endonuclease